MIKMRWDVAIGSKEDLPRIIKLMEQLFDHEYSYELHMGLAEDLPSEFRLNPIEYRFVFKKKLHPGVRFHLEHGIPLTLDMKDLYSFRPD